MRANPGGTARDERKKALGQYFTPPAVASLLAALCVGKKQPTVIDPFAGRADLLIAARKHLKPSQLAGIEIDEKAINAARTNLRNNSTTATLVQGNAFSSSTLHALDSTTYDVVITNPPYVRYQRLSRRDGSAGLGNTETTRDQLCKALNDRKLFAHLSDDERDLLVVAASKYSGHSDLAVPSWILSCALSAPQGILAMVVPEAWLSREYALITQYVLQRMFDLSYVVEDGTASWFTDAQVRTALVVARRCALRASIRIPSAEGYAHVVIRHCGVTSNSAVGAFAPKGEQPDRWFKAQVDRSAVQGKGATQGEWDVRYVDRTRHAQQVAAKVRRFKWFNEVETAKANTDGERNAVEFLIPERLHHWLEHCEEGRLVSLTHYGLRVGQGLRTGANEFFYVSEVSTRNRSNEASVRTSLNDSTVQVDRSCLQTVVRNQKALTDTLEVKRTSLTDRVLVLEGWALPEDISDAISTERLRGSAYTRMKSSLANHVRLAALTTIPTRSAVRTNARRGTRDNGRISATGTTRRWWYTLPSLVDRHLPQYFLPRVCSDTPHVYFNRGRKLVVDANFTTLWQESNNRDSADEYALLAVLNATWTRTVFELSGSVFGGGALKLEARQVARVPLPRIDRHARRELAKLGKQLCTKGPLDIILLAIDRVVLKALGVRQIENALRELREIRTSAMILRRKSLKTTRGAAHASGTERTKTSGYS